MTAINGIGEDRLIETILEQVPLGEGRARPGDDCAVIEREGHSLLLKTDAMVEGIHWDPKAEAERVGWKAIARVMSDIAAMGGTPSEFMVTLAMPAATPIDWLTRLYRGMGECLRSYGGVLVGGETTGNKDGSPIVISVAASGEASPERVVLRSTGRAGDILMVTGELGGSIRGKHLDFKPRITEARWLVKHFKPSAMMDLSDGLAKDLPRLTRASSCGLKVHRDAIPCSNECSVEQAMNDGEDYELLFSIGAERATALLEAWKRQFPELALTIIGELCASDQGDQLEGGWDHFRGES